VCALVMLVLRARHLPPTERAMQGPDAFGLGLFAASGTQIAIDASMPSIVAVLMGTVTAAFGGVLRDVVCNEIPRVFNDHRPYAVCAFAAAGWSCRRRRSVGRSRWAWWRVRRWRCCCACSRPPSTGSCRPGARSERQARALGNGSGRQVHLHEGSRAPATAQTILAESPWNPENHLSNGRRIR
jgi:hypothetical protein